MSEKSSPTPLYHRIYSVLRERVVNGYYPAGIAMPSEAELAKSFSVSRITIRKAMEMLTGEMLVTRTRGRGTFVSEQAQDNNFNRAVVADVQGLLNYLNAVGQSTKLKVISLDRGVAPPRISAQLGVSPTSELVRAVRVREMQRIPYSLSIAYLLPEVGDSIKRQDLTSTTMIDLVQQGGSHVEHVEQVMTATLADEIAAEHLEVPVGAPLMRVNRLFFNKQAKPFYAAEIFYRADRYEYRLSLRREPGKDFLLDNS
jgi:GntR family transcriptional regulator